MNPCGRKRVPNRARKGITIIITGASTATWISPAFPSPTWERCDSTTSPRSLTGCFYDRGSFAWPCHLAESWWMHKGHPDRIIITICNACLRLNPAIERKFPHAPNRIVVSSSGRSLRFSPASCLGHYPPRRIAVGSKSFPFSLLFSLHFSHRIASPLPCLLERPVESGGCRRVGEMAVSQSPQ